MAEDLGNRLAEAGAIPGDTSKVPAAGYHRVGDLVAQTILVPEHLVLFRGETRRFVSRDLPLAPEQVVPADHVPRPTQLLEEVGNVGRDAGDPEPHVPLILLSAAGLDIVLERRQLL